MAKVKQVLVIRKDLKMRRGKEIAQGAHASAAWIVDRWKRGVLDLLEPAERQWLVELFTKACLQVASLKELLDVCDKAHERGLNVSVLAEVREVEDEAGLRALYEQSKARNLKVYLITDSGQTEFKGVPTLTCLGIGPHDAEVIDQITGHLKLY